MAKTLKKLLKTGVEVSQPTSVLIWRASGYLIFTLLQVRKKLSLLANSTSIFCY